MPVSQFMRIKADTFENWDLFPEVKPIKRAAMAGDPPKDSMAQSPSGKFVYTKLTLPAGTELQVYDFSRNYRRGTAVFDQDVHIPRVNERDASGRIPTLPWMSITPNELLSLNKGLRHVKGHTVIGGLGLGWQAVKASHHPKCKRLTIVERSQDLVEWIMPRLKDKWAVEPTVVVGAAFKELPKIQADVCLLDIFPDFGDNNGESEQLRSKATGIKQWWVWGGAVKHETSRDRYEELSYRLAAMLRR